MKDIREVLTDDKYFIVYEDYEEEEKHIFTREEILSYICSVIEVTTDKHHWIAMSRNSNITNLIIGDNSTLEKIENENE